MGLNPNYLIWQGVTILPFTIEASFTIIVVFFDNNQKILTMNKLYYLLKQSDI